MKRQGDDIQTLDMQQPSKKPVVISRKEYSAKVFEFSTAFYPIEAIKKIPSQPNLSAYDKIAILGQHSRKGRVTIDTMLGRRMEVLRGLPAHEIREIIKNDFQQIDHKLKQQEIDAQNALISAYNIDTTSLAWRLAALDARDETNNSINLLKRSDTRSMWSPHLSPKIANILEKTMKENGLEPTSAHVIDMQSEYLPRSRARFKASRQEWVSDKDLKSFDELAEYENNPYKNLYTYKQIEPACFSFNPKLADYSDEQIVFTVNHEVTHALKGHNQAQMSTIENIIEHAPVSVKKEEIHAHPCYVQWLLAQETTADTYLALQNPYLARCGLTSCCYPNSYGLLKVMNDDLDMLQSLDAKAAQ